MTILGLAESFKTMNRPDLSVTLFDGLFLEKYKRWGIEVFDIVFIQVFNVCY